MVSGAAIVAWAGTAAGAATISAGVAVAGIAASQYSAHQARGDAREAGKAQVNAQNEAKAQQAQQMAEQRRAQVREERVRRARIIASSESSGTAGSSGEIGATSALATNFATNMGNINGSILSAQNQSVYNQTAADFNYKSQAHMADAKLAGTVSQAAFNIFNASGGVGGMTGSNTPKSNTDDIGGLIRAKGL